MNSCIDIAVRRVGDILSAELKRHGERMSLRTDRSGEMMSFRAKRQDKAVSFNAERIGEAISFRCGLVCSIGSDFYLQVPQESIWLLPENDFSQDVVVYSNVTWVIE